MTTIENNSNEGDFVLEDEKSTPTEFPTVREFFEGLPLYSMFTISDYPLGRYIFCGIKNVSRESDELQAVCYDMSWGDRAFFNQSEFDNKINDNWKVVETEGDMGTSALAPRYVQRILGDLETKRIDHLNMVDERNDYSRKYFELLDDFKVVNDKINEYANENHMCSDYEDRIFGWNDELKSIKLIGRERDYYVRVFLPDLLSDPSHHVDLGPVKARSPQQAREIVESWSAERVYKWVAENASPYWVIKSPTVVVDEETKPYC